MNFYHRPRRLLLDAPPSRAPPIDGGRSLGGASFDTNMVIILAALLCALICALGINSIIRFMLRCTRRVSSDATDESPPQGLKKGLLRQIPVAVYGSGEGVAFSECPICLAEYSDGEKIRVLPKCGHCFHVWCVDIWLASHSSCPTCRQSLVEEHAESGGCEVVVEVAGATRQVGNASGGHGDGGAVGSAEEVG